MKFFDGGVAELTAEVPQDVSPWSDYWYMPFGPTTRSGKSVSIEGSLAVSAVYAATRLISETVGMLPIFIYRRTKNGKEPAYGNPLFDLLHDQPNEWQTAMEWKEMMTAHAVLQGNGYSLIKSGRRGVVDQLWPMDPTRMEPAVDQTTGRATYTYTDKKGEKSEFDQDEIFHLRAFGDGVKGLSVVSLARETIGLAMAAEEHGARYFSNGAEVGGSLEHPSSLSKEAHERLEKSLKQKHAGVSNHYKTLILEEGMKWTRIGMSNEDSQFIQSRKFQLNEIARWFRLPPHMIGDLERSTFSNIEHEGISFTTYSMMPWVIRWRQAISRDLIVRTDTYFADFKVEQLLRGDTKSRYEAYQIAITNGILSPNEIRGLENLNNREGGDEYWMPMNMATSSQVANGDSHATAASVTVLPAEIKALPENINGNAMAITLMAAMPLVDREIEYISKKAADYSRDGKAWEKWLRDFYGRHAKRVVAALCTGTETAQKYCDGQINDLLSNGLGVMESWKPERVCQLASMALGEGK